MRGRCARKCDEFIADALSVRRDRCERIAKARLKPGDILFADRGVQSTAFGNRSRHVRRLASPAIERTSSSRSTARRSDPQFLRSRFSRIRASASNSTRRRRNVPAFNRSVIFAKSPLTLPPLAEQKAIAAVLGALDDKIELNRRMNATLEAMARALFQSWFVDFDPVRAKLDGRHPAGLDPATAALFPAHFQDSPLGHIPQGWTSNAGAGASRRWRSTAAQPKYRGPAGKDHGLRGTTSTDSSPPLKARPPDTDRNITDAATSLSLTAASRSERLLSLPAARRLSRYRTIVASIRVSSL